ncbi:ABC-2 family transporter protein [Rhodospirillaceae bacterium SYSU D60014]|uniref:ABC transporter permease n=1 Tax=Virgifigura deserti TaxID=2268457 RepID=UPI0013C4A318
MTRYFSLLRIFLTNSLQLEMEYRINLVMDAVNALLSFAAGLLVLYAIFDHADAIGGWSFPQALSLLGVFMILEGFIEFFLYPNFNRLPDYIRKGDMDFMLLKPVSSQFLVSFRYIRLWKLPELATGVFLLGYAMTVLDTLSVATLALTLVLLASAAAIVYSIWCMLTTTAFWLIKVDNLPELFYSLFTAGRFPVSAFPPWARFFLTFILPIAFATTVPASAAAGRLDGGMAAGSVLVAVFALLLSHGLWRLAVASYTSASS